MSQILQPSTHDRPGLSRAPSSLVLGNLYTLCFPPCRPAVLLPGPDIRNDPASNVCTHFVQPPFPCIPTPVRVQAGPSPYPWTHIIIKGLRAAGLEIAPAKPPLDVRISRAHGCDQVIKTRDAGAGRAMSATINRISHQETWVRNAWTCHDMSHEDTGTCHLEANHCRGRAQAAHRACADPCTF